MSVLLGALVVCYGATLAGDLSKGWNLRTWLALQPQAVWHGRQWQLVTHALMPVGIVDLLLSGFTLWWLGLWIERAWSRWELWSYCLLCALGAGLVKTALAGFSPCPMMGPFCLVVGLLIALLRLYGHERILFMGLGEMTLRTALGLMLAMNLLAVLNQCGPVECLIQMSAGVTAWVYLSLRWRFNLRQPAQQAVSERVRRLEM